jgi:hypothetical protein
VQRLLRRWRLVPFLCHWWCRSSRIGRASSVPVAVSLMAEVSLLPSHRAEPPPPDAVQEAGIRIRAGRQSGLCVPHSPSDLKRRLIRRSCSACSLRVEVHLPGPAASNNRSSRGSPHKPSSWAPWNTGSVGGVCRPGLAQLSSQLGGAHAWNRPSNVITGFVRLL